ncbi:hypothetical protein GC197_10930 [bacterium]|nr:hypothetical protein [bacterium]
MNSRVLILLLFVCCGCSQSGDGIPRAAVEGHVTWQGVPLKQGVIRFVPLAGGQGGKTSISIVDGTFKVDAPHGPAVGRHRIEIESTDDGGFAMDDETALTRLKESRIRKIDVVVIPPIYNTQSQLTETISVDSPNHFEFDLTKTNRR